MHNIYQKAHFHSDSQYALKISSFFNYVSQALDICSKPFLFKVAYNNCIDIIRKAKRSATMDEVVENKYSHSEQYSDTMEIVNAAVERLPEKQKSVVILRDYEGYDYRSIGEITGMTEAQVKINIFRARKFLKAYLKDIQLVI